MIDEKTVPTSLRELYLWGKKLLREREPDDALLLSEEIFHAGRREIALFGETEPPMEARQRYAEAVARRAAGEPLQYLLGYALFCGMRLQVKPGVLIPREDTAVLVERACAFLEEKRAAGENHPVGADLCSGTGAVALAVAKQCPGARVFAVELYPEPFRCLTQNIFSLALREQVAPLQKDVLLGPAPDLCGLDFLLANPPYIPSGELPFLQEEVRREPAAALDGGGDGLDFYRKLIPLWRPALKKGGLMAFEIGETQAEAVTALLRENGFEQLRTDRDLAGLDRVVSGIRP